MKPWITTEITTHADQIILVQPAPEFNGIEMGFKEMDGTHQTNALYINKDELPIIIKKLQEMMEYVTNK
jgi:hypothetical protein